MRRDERPTWRRAPSRRAVLAGLSLGLISSRDPLAAQTGPPKPKVRAGRDPGGIAVAVIGAGVDYRRPEIAARLARDGEGEIIAWDVIDDDARPLEAPSAHGRRLPPEAGTVTIELNLLAPDPKARLIPVRVPDANPLALGGALAFAALTPARIAVVLVGGMTDPQPLSWQLFQDTAKRAPHLLIVVPAGHYAMDIDGLETAPARLPIPNLVVVTAATAEGRVTASWGAKSVDVAVGSETALAIGAAPESTGAALENAAALQLAAIASGIAAKVPGLDGVSLKAGVLALARPMPAGAPKRTRTGWIRAPAGEPARTP